MHIPTHFLVSWAFSNVPRLTARERFSCLLCGTLPDLDGLGIVVSQDAYEDYHHVVGHNLLAGGVLCGLLALTAKRERRSLVFGICLACFHLHLLLDLLGSGPGWTISYLWPFSSHRSEWETLVWEFGGWQNKAAFLLTVALSYGIARRHQRTFFEYFFPAGDKILLRWMRIPPPGEQSAT